jgi:hypothetical protein
LIDDSGNQLGEKITVSASGSGGGGGGSLYTYNIRNGLSSTKFNATTAESSIKIKFRCEEKDSEGLIQGTASTVIIEYSSDKNSWSVLETIEAQNGQDVEREYAIETLKTGVNYIRVSGTAGTAENASGRYRRRPRLLSPKTTQSGPLIQSCIFFPICTRFSFLSVSIFAFADFKSLFPIDADVFTLHPL